MLLPVALACLWFGGVWFLALMCLAAAAMAWEWTTMCGHRLASWPEAVAPVALVLATILGAGGHPVLALGVLAVGTAGLILLGRGARPLTLALGVPYIGIAAAALAWLRADPAAGWGNTLFMLVIIWSSDIGAYLAGRTFGGPKLAPAISPGKTRSGAVGGLIAASLAGLAVAASVSGAVPVGRVLVLSALLGVAAQAGDLFESGLKRHFGVKDSSHLIPGHGGVLDRLDAVLPVAPIAAILAWWAGQGEFLWR